MPETVCFTVTGEFITEQARSFWNLEKDPERALRLVMCLQGITRAQALDVLEGRSKLVGDSGPDGIRLEPDTAQCKTLDQILGQQRKELEEAQDEREDLAQMLSGDTVIVPSHTGAREIPRRKARHVGRGLVDGYEFDDVNWSEEQRIGLIEKPKPTKKQRIYRRKDVEYRERYTKAATERNKQAEINERAAQLKRDSDAMLKLEQEREEQAREAEFEAARQRAKEALQPTDKITTDTGWLSPEGKFYPCLYGDHARTVWALGLAAHPADHSAKPPGWVRLSVMSDRQCFEEEGDVSAVQKDRIREWCAESGAALPWWMKEQST